MSEFGDTDRVLGAFILKYNVYPRQAKLDQHQCCGRAAAWLLALGVLFLFTAILINL